MGKSKEIIVDSKQSKNKEPSETKLKKSKKEDISESIPIVENKKDNLIVSELDTIVETKSKKGKKDKVNISELDTIVEIKKDNIIVSELDTIVETKSKKGKKDKANITELELIPIVETKKTKKDKVNKLESVPIIETKKTKKDKVNKLESVPIVETKKSNKEKEVDKSSNDDENAKKLDVLIPKSSAITNPEFIILKNKWYELTKKIENLNNERDILEIDKNNFVSEMCKIIEKHQPKVENLLEQKTTTISKSTISSKLLENDSDDSDSSDSDDEVPIKKKITAKKILAESSDDDDSDSD